jgi:hypothetical protein
MWNIVVHWTKFTPRVHDVYTDFLGEMYGYCQAAAHLELPHTISTSFMISDVLDPRQEGWDFLEGMGRDEVCQPVDPEKLPFVFHFCQRYALGRWFVGKYIDIRGVRPKVSFVSLHMYIGFIVLSRRQVQAPA